MTKKVYFFKGYKIMTDEMPRSKRRATLEAIKGKGEPLLDTELEVDESDIDEDGFLRD